MVDANGIRKSSVVPQAGPGAVGVTVKPADKRIYFDRGNSYTETLPLGGTKVVDAALTLTAADDGVTLFLSLAAGFTVTLPAPAAGLRFKAIVAVAPTTAYLIVSAGGTDNIHGVVSSREDAAGSVDGTLGTAADTITFAANLALKGDYIDLISDGTSWYVSGAVGVQDALTFTQT